MKDIITILTYIYTFNVDKKVWVLTKIILKIKEIWLNNQLKSYYTNLYSNL